MAIANMIAHGLGFTPGTIRWIPTYGLGSSTLPDVLYASPVQSDLRLLSQGDVSSLVVMTSAELLHVH